MKNNVCIILYTHYQMGNYSVTHKDYPRLIGRTIQKAEVLDVSYGSLDNKGFNTLKYDKTNPGCWFFIAEITT